MANAKTGFIYFGFDCPECRTFIPLTEAQGEEPGTHPFFGNGAVSGECPKCGKTSSASMEQILARAVVNKA